MAAAPSGSLPWPERRPLRAGLIEEDFAGARARSDHPAAYIERAMQTASQRRADDGAEILRCSVNSGF